MKQAIVNFCKKMDSGLCLIDMPTGFGKTYSILDFMVDNYDQPEFKDKKIFFITTLKKNLPDEDLRGHFACRGKVEDYDKFCLRIDANSDSVIENLERVYRKIPYSITSKQEFKDLLETVKLINQYNDKKKESTRERKRNYIGDGNGTIAALCKKLEEDVRTDKEHRFRELIIRELKKFKTPKEKLKQIENNPDYQWIGELYPAVYTREKRIYFMSMDKFFLGNTTIIEPTYSFYNNDITKNAIIFIDEYDATKSRLLNQIIDRGLNNQVDFLSLFLRIHSALKTRVFPAELTNASKQQMKYLEEHKRSKSPLEIINKFEEVFDDTYNKYSMQFSFKTENDGKENGRNFIFNDLQYHSIFEGNNAFVNIRKDAKAKQNWLKFTDKKITEDDLGVLDLLSSVKGCLTYFERGVRILAYNYKQNKDENKLLGEDDYTFENAIESVLSEFHLSREQRRYLKPIVMGVQAYTKRDKSNEGKKLSLSFFEGSVYDKGFRYFDFIDDPNHDMRSEIKLFDFQESPERILVGLAERARIIGVSATATLDTVIGNYDLEYHKRLLKDKYYVIPKEDQERLRYAFEEYTELYKNVNIHVEPVTYSADIRIELTELLNGQEALVKKYTEKINNTFSGCEYAKNNFIRVLKVLKAFILNPSVKSFLCLNNNLPHENKTTFDLNLVREFTDIIAKAYGIKDVKGKELIYSINSEDYDAKRAEFIRRLSEGEKLFVISSYNTVGAGQNLQYKVPDGVDVVAVNNYPRGDREKDFDCIYLEDPSNLIVNVDNRKELDDIGLINYIYQIEFLMGRGEVSRKTGISVIKNAFSRFGGGHAKLDNKKEPYKTQSVNNYALRTLIQAVGRICRTGLKNPDIYIYVDDDVLKKYDFSVLKNRLLNPEFAKIVEASKEYESIPKYDNYLAVLENMAAEISLRNMNCINILLRKLEDENVEYWKALRELYLKCPTMEKSFVDGNAQYGNMYVTGGRQINAYSYSQEGDYNKNIRVKFDDSLPQKVSDVDAHLPDLMEIPGVKSYFKDMGYATSFIPNEYIMSPVFFNNIYKGALGETVGKYILENYAMVKLYEMGYDLYELFDYDAGNGVYVDFKLWKDTMSVSAEYEKVNIINKLEKCGGKRAVIINILMDRDMPITTSYDGRIVEIPYLYRTDRKELATEIIDKINKEGYLR